MFENNLQEKIALFKQHLFEYNKSINIYSKKSYENLDYHIEDSLNLTKLASDSKLHVDLGSGSGLPGVIMAIASKSEIICVESKQKKRLFLNYLKDALDLTNLSVFEGDVQLFSKIHSKAIIESFSAKAFAKPPKLLMYLSMFRKYQYSPVSVCWVPISEKQANVLSEFDEITTIHSNSGQVFRYFKIHMGKFQSYKVDLKKKYNL